MVKRLAKLFGHGEDALLQLTACKPVLAPAGNVESSLGKRRKGEKHSVAEIKSDIVVGIL